MDEYLFIVLAKLKADRLKLEREERFAAARQQDPRQQELFVPRSPTQHRSPKARWFSSEPDWPVRT
jgi:hypothetical protein